MRFESVLFRSLGTPWAPPFYLLSTPLLGGPDTSRISYLEEENATTISIISLGEALGRLWELLSVCFLSVKKQTDKSDFWEGQIPETI